MAFTEFCCRSGGSNLNAGTRTGNSTEPGTSADFTYASGTWVASTGVFTVASGNPSTDGVAAGDFASVYADGSTVTGFVGYVTNVTSTTITVSLTVKSGTAPTDGTGNRTLKIGGAWQGPNGTDNFPFGFVTNTLMNAANNFPRVNLKNDQTYSVSTQVAASQNGPIWWQGYTSSYGDLGKFTITNSVAGGTAAFVVSGASNWVLDFIQTSTATTGAGDGIVTNSGGFVHLIRCVVHTVRGDGININITGCAAIECEVYNANLNNTSGDAAFKLGGASSYFIRCVAHDNTGSNGVGFIGGAGTQAGQAFIDCISDSNGSHGFFYQGRDNGYFFNCDAYNNGGSGFRIIANTVPIDIYMENCNSFKNSVYGIDIGATTSNVYITNQSYGSGTQANTSGTINGTNNVVEIDSTTYPADTTPWVDPANGNFSINHSSAKGTGRGTFTQTAASYGGTVGYPDRGAAQHQEIASPVNRAIVVQGIGTY